MLENVRALPTELPPDRIFGREGWTRTNDHALNRRSNQYLRNNLITMYTTTGLSLEHNKIDRRHAFRRVYYRKIIL